MPWRARRGQPALAAWLARSTSSGRCCGPPRPAPSRRRVRPGQLCRARHAVVSVHGDDAGARLMALLPGRTARLLTRVRACASSPTAFRARSTACRSKRRRSDHRARGRRALPRARLGAAARGPVVLYNAPLAARVHAEGAQSASTTACAGMPRPRFATRASRTRSCPPQAGDVACLLSPRPSRPATTRPSRPPDDASLGSRRSPRSARVGARACPSSCSSPRPTAAQRAWR